MLVRGARAEAHPDRVQRPLAGRGLRGAALTGLVGLAAEQGAHERVRAEQAVAHPDAVLGGQRRREVRAVPAVHHERDDADARRVVPEQREHPHLRHRRETGADRADQVPLPLHERVEPGLVEGLAGGGDGVRADDVGRPRLVPGGRVVPLDVHSPVGAPRDLPRGAAAREVRLGALQPVGPAREHSGAERGVQLVPGEGDPVDVQLPYVHRVVGRELGGVEDDAGAVGVRGGGQLAHRPQLAGDVRGAGHADQGGPVGVAVGEGALQGVDGLVVGARGVEVGDAGVAPGQQRGVVLGLEHEDLAVGGQRGGQQVQRVGGRPREHHLVALAAPQELGDGLPRVLEQVGRQLRQVPRAAVHTPVVGRVRGHVVPHPLQGRRAGGVVERDVRDLAAGDEGDGDVAPEDGQRGTDGGVGGNGGGRHDELP
ncbi:putative cysteine desulfurase [Streptomyces aurantiacus JA 4570]|uniref:Putative cysteine desulfurase n=1 Tax=Streptomyces aurantiacus JA 4570 TaxID=1286094 RepID=S3ZRM7_9ACTN|nr:putative cysteine desulfurase [Streptomyces aurantiacus JA 4570]